MRALFVTSEVYPLAKTGGLADVSAALPAALRDFGIDSRILLPAYTQALERAESLREIVRLRNVLGYGQIRLLETRLPGSHVPVWLVDCPDLYSRSGGPYQDEAGSDWSDNAQRFALLSHVAAGIANEVYGHWRPQIVHANDWHAGLLPLLLQNQAGASPATVFTIHNLAYQGLFRADAFERLELPLDRFQQLEFFGQISFLKGGIASADAVTTVSRNYATEILTPEYGCGLDGLLRERAASIAGILNGADYGLWDPSIDPHIQGNYTSRSLAGKQACKIAIQKEFRLTPDYKVPLLAYMSRLVHQKMPDVLLQILPSLLKEGLQLAVVAEGESQYQGAFQKLADQHPGRVAVRTYDEPIAHRLLAGADVLLHPSRYEPCGLLPIYAMRYGTIPIVRRSGGMADTVTDAAHNALSADRATGFSFDGLTAAALVQCIERALALFQQPIRWRRLQRSAMRQDFSWRSSAEQYAGLYRSLINQPEPERVQGEEAVSLSKLVTIRS